MQVVMQVQKAKERGYVFVVNTPLWICALILEQETNHFRTSQFVVYSDKQYLFSVGSLEKPVIID